MSAAKKSLMAESTDVPAGKSIVEIQALLVKAGALAISTNYSGAKVESLSFVLPYGGGRIPYLLPARTEPVFKRVNGRRQEWGQFSQSAMAAKDRDQAERIAWRQMFWWLKSQLALIDLGMVESAEVLLPYMLGPDGRSFFDTYKPRMIAAPQGAAQ